MRRCKGNVERVVRTSTPRPGNTLTTLPAPTYHNWMTPRSQVAAGAILLAGIAGISGCEDAAKKAVAHAAGAGSAVKAPEQRGPRPRVGRTGAKKRTPSAPPLS